MTMNALQEALSRRLVPVVMIEDAAAAGPLGDALIQGGLPCVEITLRSAAALKALAAMTRRGDMIVGAGTVISIGQVRQALDAGAQFMVSPGFNAEMVQYCRDLDIPLLPGVCTPTEIQTAQNHGLETLKYFPAEAFGGLRTLQALCAPFPMMRFVPTGGVTAENLAGYLRHPSVAACGGSWMVDRQLIASRRFAEITRRVRDAMEIVAKSMSSVP